MNRRAQAVALLLVGGAVLHIGLTDIYLRYVKAGLRPLLVAAGALLVLTAVMTLWYSLRGTNDAAADDPHGHSHRSPHAWLIIVPVLGALLLTPPALGSYTASRSGTALTHVSQFRRLPVGDPVTISVVDYASRAAFDTGRSLDGRSVRLSGFALTGPHGEQYLARMIIVCCAADAGPVKVGLTGRLPADLKPDTWLQVTGRFTPRSTRDPINGRIIPYLDVVDVQQIPAPASQYES